MEACTIVLFGATGDLSRRKLIPALFLLDKEGLLHRNTKIVAIGRQDLTDSGIRKHLKEFVKGKGWKKFSERIHYHRLDFFDKKAYAGLGEYLGTLPSTVRNKRLFYLATPQQAFGPIVNQLKKYRIAERSPKKGWHRVVFEKPFGSDLKSAEALNRKITNLFDEKQIYRIDHYVGKSLVQEVLVLRFANPVFESTWNHKHVKHVHITVAEKGGVGSRGGYYDSSGALRDMVQNHLLQLLTLVAMEEPKALKSEDIRDQKARVLRAVDLANMDHRCGQYVGYEKDIGKKSNTETYAAVKLFLKNKRWDGVPFYLVTGKALDRRYAEIVVEFSTDECPLFRDPRIGCGENKLIINIQPDEGITFAFNLAKQSGSSFVSQKEMTYVHDTEAMNTPQAYELLLLEAINGVQTLFTRWDFVREAWKVVDELRKGCPEPQRYRKGSHGPRDALAFLDHNL